MIQPDCLDPLPSRDLLADVAQALPTPNIKAAMWMWGAVFIAVLVFEAWAIWTGNYTMSESVWHGPKWFKWVLGAGLGVLIYHLFIQR